MKVLLFALAFVLLAACAAPAAPPTAPPTPTPRPIVFADPKFVFQGEDPGIPVLTHDPSPQIKNLYINPGAVIYHEGKFHMFFNSFTQWPGLVKGGLCHLDRWLPLDTCH